MSLKDFQEVYRNSFPVVYIVLMVIYPTGILHDFSYVVLAKSKEQLLNKNWNLALELLIVLDKELQVASCNVSKLSKMVNWEVLLIQITQMMEEWPWSSVGKLENFTRNSFITVTCFR